MEEKAETLFKENFDSLIDYYAEAIKVYPGEPNDALIHSFVEDLNKYFQGAVKYNYTFDIIKIAEDFCEATMFRIDPEGLLYKLLSFLPAPYELDEDGQFTLAQVLDPVEQALPGTLERLKWEWKQAKAAA